jgi:hypothetical protein
MTFRSDPKPADFKPLYHARGRMNAALRRVRAQSVGYLRPGFPRVLEDYSFLFPPAEVVDLASVRAAREGRPLSVRHEVVAAEPSVSTTQMVGLLTRLLRSLKR